MNIQRFVGEYIIDQTDDGSILITDKRDGRQGGINFTVGPGLSAEDFIYSMDADDCESALPFAHRARQVPQKKRGLDKRLLAQCALAAAVAIGLLVIAEAFLK